MYRDHPVALVKLKDAIRRHVPEIPSEMFLNAVQRIIYRFAAVLKSDGRHIEKL